MTRMTEEKVRHMLSISQQDYERYEKTSDIAYLQDASEKLFTSAENLVECKTGEEVKDYDSFKRLLPRLMPSESERIALKSKLSQLHVFHIHGLLEPNDANDMKRLYRNVSEELYFLLENLAESKPKRLAEA